MSENPDDPSSIACNIGPRGRWIRLTVGFLAVGASLWLWFGKNDAFWAIGLVVTGLFMIYEGAKGWCVIRALGIKTRF